MKICLFIHNLNNLVGGAEKAIVDLASALVSADHKVDIVTYDRLSGEPFFAVDSDVKIHNLYNASYNLVSPPAKTHQSNIINDSAIVRFRKRQQLKYEFLRKLSIRRRKWALAKSIDTHLSSSKPDIIISFMPAMTIVLGLSKLAAKIPKIFFCHTEPDRDFGLGNCQLRAQVDGRNLADALRNFDATVVLSDCFIEQAASQTSHQVIAIPNIVNSPPPDTYDLTMWELRDKIIVFVGRLEEIKRPFLMLEAWKIFTADNPDSWQLHIYGRGQMEDEMRTFVENNKMSAHCQIMGLTRDTMSVFLNARLALLPSGVEGLPISLIEGMACGTPGIGISDCRGTSDLLNGCGYLAENPTPQSLAKMFEKATRDVSELKRMSLAARNKCQQFAGAVVMKKWEELFSKLISQHTEKIPQKPIHPIIALCANSTIK